MLDTMSILKKGGILLSAIELKEQVQAMGADLVGVAVLIHPFFMSTAKNPRHFYLRRSR
jgi:hypothetical protein